MSMLDLPAALRRPRRGPAPGRPATAAAGARRRLLPIVLTVVSAWGLAACDKLTDPHQRGQQALARGDYEAALAAFNEAIAEGEYPAEAYANRGIAHEAMKNYESAVADYNEALALMDAANPQRAEVLNNRGVAYLGLRRIEEAMADFDAAIEANPSYADAFANRGRAQVDHEDYEAAIEDLTRAIDLNPELAEAFGNRALVHENMGDDEKAIADYSRAIEIRHDPQAYFNRGMLRYTLGCFNLAYQDFTEVVERSDESDYLWYMGKSQRDFLEQRPRDKDTCMGSESEADRAAGQGEGSPEAATSEAATPELGATTNADDATAPSPTPNP